METLPKISATPLKNDAALYARLDTIQNQLSQGQETDAAIVDLLSQGLTALGTALINLRAEQKSALADVSGRIEQGRYREVAELVTDRFGAVSQEFQGAKAEITNRLADLETTVAKLEHEVDPNIVPALQRILEFAQSVAATINGLSTATEGRATRLENLLADLGNRIDEGIKIEQQTIPDYTSDFVLVGQRLSEIQNKINATDSESTALGTKFDAFCDKLTEEVNAKLSTLETKIFAAQSTQQNQLDVMKGEAAKNFATITDAVNEMVSASATSVQALTKAVSALNDSIESLKVTAPTTEPVAPIVEPVIEVEPSVEPSAEPVVETPVEEPKGPEITGTVITPDDGVANV